MQVLQTIPREALFQGIEREGKTQETALGTCKESHDHNKDAGNGGEWVEKVSTEEKSVQRRSQRRT